MAATSTAPATKPDPLVVVVDGLAETGPLTAAALAAHLGIAYSTITPRLRRLEADHRAERVREDVTGRTLWRVVPAQATAPSPIPTPTAGAAAGSAPPSAPEGVDPRTDEPPLDMSSGNDTPATPDSDSGDASAATGVTPPGHRITDPPAIDAETPSTGGGPPGGATTAATGPVDGRDPGSSPRPRRPKGSIAHDVLGVLRARPDDAFKIAQLSAALGGTSAGAIANALHKLVVDGSVTQVSEKPATYQAA